MALVLEGGLGQQPRPLWTASRWCTRGEGDETLAAIVEAYDGMIVVAADQTPRPSESRLVRSRSTLTDRYSPASRARSAPITTPHRSLHKLTRANMGPVRVLQSPVPGFDSLRGLHVMSRDNVLNRFARM